MIPIDYQKSISKSRIVFKESTLSKLAWKVLILTINTLVAFFMYLIIEAFNDYEKTANNIGGMLLVVIVLVYISILVNKNAITLTKLKSVHGLVKSRNRAMTEKVLSDMEVNLVYKQKGYFIGIVRNSVTSWGHQITILFQDDMVHVNSITFDRFGGKSPFNLWSDGINVHTFLSRFKEELVKTKGDVID